MIVNSTLDYNHSPTPASIAVPAALALPCIMSRRTGELAVPARCEGGYGSVVKRRRA